MQIYGRTDRGRVRDNNEDCFAFDRRHGIAVLADGMGGLNAGEVASACAVRAVLETLEEAASGAPAEASETDVGADGLSPEQLRAAMGDALRAANRSVLDGAAERPEREGMATTLVAALVQHECCVIGHVGDSRAYRFRANDLERLTTDHSLVQQLVDAGLLSEAGARTAPNRNIVTNALGMAAELDYELRLDTRQPGDLLLLCSDGLSELLDDAEIRAHCRAHCAPHGQTRQDANAAASDPVLEALVDALVASALERGGTDNVTVVGVRC